jgi:hypothetical protein
MCQDTLFDKRNDCLILKLSNLKHKTVNYVIVANLHYFSNLFNKISIENTGGIGLFNRCFLTNLKLFFTHCL